MADRSKLVRMNIKNIGCVGPEGVTIELNDILCIVGANNCGKSVILRAYELAVGNISFNPENDLCSRADKPVASVELWVHIPEGIENIASKWKIPEDDLLLVRSKWEWSDASGWQKKRYTWDPETNEYSDAAKASGLDPVFYSRLPQPFRIGSLEDPAAEHQKLLTFIIQPIADKLKMQLADTKSDLCQALDTATLMAKKPVADEKAKLETLNTDLNTAHNEIFPDLKIDIDIDIGSIEFDPLQELKRNSFIKFHEWDKEVRWVQQGTGSQRALFWTMLQVRSKLKAISDVQLNNERRIKECEKKIHKLEGEIKTVKKPETKQKKGKEIAELTVEISQLKECNPEELLDKQSSELALPGYMLIIDEPEIALHPSSIRAASKHLYNLAKEPAWQIMIATHSPLFLDPLQDHTTVVRLDREECNPTPRTFRSDAVNFSTNEKENLRLLNRFDQGIAEMFFGQLPLIVEGDTEFAAFEMLMNKYANEFPSSIRPILIRARGKYPILGIIKILHEFRIRFAILHDADYPFRRDGRVNNAWIANEKIFEAVKQVRATGVKVTHRISLPNFEFAHTPVDHDKNGFVKEISMKDKPWSIIDKIRSNPDIEESILNILRELTDPNANEEPFGGDFVSTLTNKLCGWAEVNSPGDPCYIKNE